MERRHLCVVEMEGGSREYTRYASVIDVQRSVDRVSVFIEFIKFTLFIGYRFRDLPRNNGTTPAAVTENLKSPEELENEDRGAQSAVIF
jgi:hypothetical protein